MKEAAGLIKSLKAGLIEMENTLEKAKKRELFYKIIRADYESNKSKCIH